MIRKIVALLCISLATACGAQPPIDDEMNAGQADLGDVVSSDENQRMPDFQVTEASLAQMAQNAQLQPPVADIVKPPANVVCPADGRVAFSVTGASHVSQGNALLLGYNDKIYTNVGGGWPNVLNGSTFTAPCTGLYVFTVSFVRDSMYNGGSTDDVYVFIDKNGTSMGSAWSGEANVYRMTGTYTVTMMLSAGDSVHTTVGSDGGYKRHLANYNFSGFLLK
jgi:hypothetical protein